MSISDMHLTILSFSLAFALTTNSSKTLTISFFMKLLRFDDLCSNNRKDLNNLSILFFDESIAFGRSSKHISKFSSSDGQKKK